MLVFTLTMCKDMTKPKRYKYSSQRQKIISILSGARIHPTASMLYDEIKKDIPNVSMGTVYRNLKVLIEQGIVKKLDFGTSSDRFELKRDPHHHFICKVCEGITDIEIPKDISLIPKLEDSYNFSIQSCDMVFYGVCENCKNKETKENK